MGADLALIKILESNSGDLNSFLSAFPTQLLLRVASVKGVAGGQLGLIEFMGYALPGTTKAQPRWLIKKFVYDSEGFQTDAIFADGTAKFDKIFDTGASEYSGYNYATT